MQVALYARVSTDRQQQEGTIASQVRSLKESIVKQQWNLLPQHEFLDEGCSGAHLDRPGLDRLRDCAQRGEFEAVVVLSPDRLARNYAHQWLVIEELEKSHVRCVFVQNPFADSPQGKLVTQVQGMIAEYERTQILERTRRGRLEKARQGRFIPWAYHCYGYRYLHRRHDSSPEVIIEPQEAEIVRRIFRLLVEEHLSCRQITKQLNEDKIPTPSRQNSVWHPAAVRDILKHRVYAGLARYNYRQVASPKWRQTGPLAERLVPRGRSYRPEEEWIWSAAPAIISQEVFEQAQQQLARNRELAKKLYQASSGRYLLRCLVKCGECGLGMGGTRQSSVCKKYEYLYYTCRGHNALSCGRAAKCSSRRVRAGELDQIVWDALCAVLQQPNMLPQLHASWATAKQQNAQTLSAQQEQLQHRQQQLERQRQRLLDAYQADFITMTELGARQEKLRQELKQIQIDHQRLAQASQEILQWQQIVENTQAFVDLLGGNLNRLSFEERQEIVQCLIRKIVVTDEEVDIHYAFPFLQPPRPRPHEANGVLEGVTSRFYGLRMAHLDVPPSTMALALRAGPTAAVLMFMLMLVFMLLLLLFPGRGSAPGAQPRGCGAANVVEPTLFRPRGLRPPRG